MRTGPIEFNYNSIIRTVSTLSSDENFRLHLRENNFQWGGKRETKEETCAIKEVDSWVFEDINSSMMSESC